MCLCVCFFVCVCALISEAVNWQGYVASVKAGRVGIKQRFPQCAPLTPRDPRPAPK